MQKPPPHNVPKASPAQHVKIHGLRYSLPPLALTVKQLKDALMYVAPDYPMIDEFAGRVCIALRDEGKDIDGEMLPRGLYVWLEDYPEEGALLLREDDK
jgi:hypothetical protein